MPHPSSVPDTQKTSRPSSPEPPLIFMLDVRYDQEADVVYVSDSSVAGLTGEAKSLYPLLLKIADRICELKTINPTELTLSRLYGAPEESPGTSGSSTASPQSGYRPEEYTVSWEVSLTK